MPLHFLQTCTVQRSEELSAENESKSKNEHKENGKDLPCGEPSLLVSVTLQLASELCAAVVDQHASFVADSVCSRNTPGPPVSVASTSKMCTFSIWIPKSSTSAQKHTFPFGNTYWDVSVDSANDFGWLKNLLGRKKKDGQIS